MWEFGLVNWNGRLVCQDMPNILDPLNLDYNQEEVWKTEGQSKTKSNFFIYSCLLIKTKIQGIFFGTDFMSCTKYIRC